MQAACALAQMDRLEGFIAKRRENFDYLRKKLISVEQYFHLPEATPNSQPSWFGFPLILKHDSGVKRNDLINYLEDNKIGTRLFFAGNLTKQPYMSSANYRISGTLTNTEIILNNTFWIGVYPGLTQDHMLYIVDKIEDFFGLNF